MAAVYAPISQEVSNFRKKTAKKFTLPPKFQKVRFEMHKSLRFLQYLRYIVVSAIILYISYHLIDSGRQENTCRRTLLHNVILFTLQPNNLQTSHALTALVYDYLSVGCHQMTCRTSVQCVIIDCMCYLPIDVYTYQSQSES